MGKYKTYEKYKPSALEWTEEIPEHWELRKLKFVAQLRYGDSLPSEFRDDGEIPVFGSNGAVGSHSSSNTLAPCIIVGRKGSYGKVTFSESHAFAIDTTYFIDASTIQTSLSFRWLYYALSTLGLDSFSQDTGVPGLSREFAHNRPLIFPPLDEQKVIAHFLDSETTRIDTLITKKRQLIDLLQRKRDALVDSFVIKVSAPCEAIKKADMSWLADLPNDWKNVRLKFLASFITSGSRGWAEYYSNEGSIFLRIGNLSTESIDLDLTDLQFVQPPKGAEGERTKVHPNDLLISITALIGAVGVVPSNLSEAYVNQHTALVRLLNQRIHSRWAAYCVFSSLGQKQLGEFTSGGTKDGLTLNDVGNLLILIPPDKQQELHVKELDRKINSIQSTILKTKESIKTLEKHRTALITSAVTGKINVREEAD